MIPAALLAAILHLLALLAAERLGWDPSADISLAPPPERYLELSLEVNAPSAAKPPASTEAAPAAPPAAATEAAPAEPEALQPPEDVPAALPYDASVLEGSADAAGPLADDNAVNLEEAAPKLKSYNTLVRTAVARRWILPPAARNNFQSGRFVAVMTLDRLGQVLVIMVEESSGFPALDFAAMEALRGAAPYPPFPPELEEHESLNFRLHFDYRAVRRRPGGGQAQ
jgi:protein TonB